jgi:Holliday junction resolvasome RuvABC DNA-binding subunit
MYRNTKECSVVDSISSVGSKPASQVNVTLQNKSSNQSEKVAAKILEGVESTPEPGKGIKVNETA